MTVQVNASNVFLFFHLLFYLFYFIFILFYLFILFIYFLFIYFIYFYLFSFYFILFFFFFLGGGGVRGGVIVHPRHNINCAFAKQTLELGHGWVFTSHKTNRDVIGYPCPDLIKLCQ